MAKNLEKTYSTVVGELKRHIRGGVRTSISGLTNDPKPHVIRASFGAIPASLDEDTVIGEMAHQAEVSVSASVEDKSGGTSSFKATGIGVAILFGHEPTGAQRGVPAKPETATSDNGTPVPVGAAS